MKIINIKSFIKLCAIVVISLFISGCVYYNTFYHANKKYREANKTQQKSLDGKANDANKRVYEEAIKKASKVLTFHPESKYVDDALYLIGKSYFNMEEWHKAERKFKELIVNFPESEFAVESAYLLGVCHVNLDNYNQAEESLREIISRPEKTDYSDDAAYMLAEIWFDKEEYSDAIEYYEDMLEKYPKSDLKAKAYTRIGKSHFELKQYTDAKTNYDKALKSGPDTGLRYEILYQSGECLYKLGKYEEGLKIFKDLKGNRKYFEKLGEIKIKYAEGLKATDEEDKAIELYEEIIIENPKTEQSAQACYEIGDIYQDRNDLEKAKESYIKGKDEKRDSEYSQLCLNKSSEITKLETYRATLSGSADQSEVTKTQLLLAEAMLIDFDQPDSAAQEYKRILTDFPGSEETPLAYFALGYINRKYFTDTTTAESLYIELAGRYPDTKYGIRAAEILGISEALPDSLNPEKMLAYAEKKLLTDNDPDSAIVIYHEIEANHPGTDYAAQSAFAVSYIVDHYIVPADSTAIFAYQRVLDAYPRTEYAEVAELRLGKRTRQTAERKFGETSEDDTTSTFDPEDTTTYKETGMELAPEPENMGELIWPQELIREELRGFAVLKFFVGFFGEITEVEIFTTSGHEELDQAILKAMQETSYEAQNMESEELNRYYLYKYEFVSPEAEKNGGDRPDLPNR
ncbi:MAG: tetratricopeptide repeat protein [candidate division Zixibacteria bacterium]|nr:tetratricopeptide repeat protein [candidate division Zixibacteria bacterium]